MSTWAEVAAAEPEFADRVRRIFDASRHKVLATIRRDGSPRASGIEVEFADGEVWMGVMPGSVKAQDLRRDPRLALHAASEDPPQDDPSNWLGDAKISGRAVEVVELGDAGEEVVTRSTCDRDWYDSSQASRCQQPRNQCGEAGSSVPARKPQIRKP